MFSEPLNFIGTMDVLKQDVTFKNTSKWMLRTLLKTKSFWTILLLTVLEKMFVRNIKIIHLKWKFHALYIYMIVYKCLFQMITFSNKDLLGIGNDLLLCRHHWKRLQQTSTFLSASLNVSHVYTACVTLYRCMSPLEPLPEHLQFV